MPKAGSTPIKAPDPNNRKLVMSGVTLSNVTKKYGPLQVIHGVDLEIEDGEFCVFVGPSGCGKSTLLRMVAGLEDTTSGEISIGGRDVTRADPADRGVAMVFQTYALYPHMTVRENMGFGLKMNKVTRAEIQQRVGDSAAILQLEPYLDRKPKALSGGQRQRVAIGRAIVRGPEVFLFDEPLSNLDAELRVEMRVEIARLHKEIGATMIYVTHDQVEAMTLADRIVVLRDGVIEQSGSPLQIYKDPDNKFVAGFIGSPAMNFLDGQVKDGRLVMPDLGGDAIATSAGLPDDGTGVTLGLRPQFITLNPAGGGFTVEITEHLGGTSFVYLRSPGGARLVVEADEETAIAPGSQVGISFDPENAMFFDTASEKRIR
jgi:lactose/L-arabinose transport system ATP-binding protein